MVSINQSNSNQFIRIAANNAEELQTIKQDKIQGILTQIGIHIHL